MIAVRLTRVALTSLVALSAAAGLVTAQAQKPPRGTRVAVVAFRDSNLFTICPVLGDEVLETGVWMSSMAKVKATVRVPPPVFTPPNWPTILIAVHHPDFLRTPNAVSGVAQLPLPAVAAPPPPPAVPPPQTGAGLLSSLPIVTNAPTQPVTALDRLTVDLDLRARIEDALRQKNVYAVVETVDRADYVFVAESRYIAMAATTGGALQAADSASVTSYFLSGDRQPNWRQSVLALLVPAAVYRTHAGDGHALVAARVWESFAFEERARNAKGFMASRAASPDALADAVGGKWPVKPSSLPLCAASAQRLRMPGETTATPAAADAAASPPTPVPVGAAPFRATTTLVTVPLTLTDTSGRPVLDARLPEFHVFENGVEQKTDRLFPVTAPWNVALLLDASGSMRSRADELRSAAQAFVDRVRPEDRVLLASFGNRVGIHAEFTTDRARLREAIAQVGTSGGTRLHDALVLLLADRLVPVEGPKAIVLLTDGVDTRSQLTDAATALAAVEGANTAVYVVRYDTADAARLPATVKADRWVLIPDGFFDSTAAQGQADAFLARLAAGSGGRMYVVPTGTGVNEVLGEIARDLASQYTLCYYSSNDRLDGAWREIRVAIDRPGHTVRARKGYRAAIAKR